MVLAAEKAVVQLSKIDVGLVDLATSRDEHSLFTSRHRACGLVGFQNESNLVSWTLSIFLESEMALTGALFEVSSGIRQFRARTI
jgi:hypothetical protein